MTRNASLPAFLRIALLVVLPTVIACVVALELGLRVLGRLPSNTTEGLFQPMGTSAYRLRKNMSKVSRTPSYTCTVHTNEHGFRDRSPGARDLGGPFWAFLGDSLTFGNGVDYEESFVGVFGALAEREGLGAVNLAVGGHHLAEQEQILDAVFAGRPERPARVVVMFTAPLAAAFDVQYDDIVVKDGYLFQRDRWLVKYVTVLLGNRSSAYCFFRDGVRKAQMKLFPAPPATAAELLAIFRKDHPTSRPEFAAGLEQALARLDARIRALGATPVYAYLPSAADLRSAEILRTAGEQADAYDFLKFKRLLEGHAAAAGLELVDLLPAMEEEHAKGVPLSFQRDMHYDVGPNRVIGEALYAALLGHGEQHPGVVRPASAP